MQYLQSAIDQKRAHLETAQIFVNKYGSKMPENLPVNLQVEWGAPSLSLHLPFRLRMEAGERASHRERLLSTAGDIFGREGWSRHLSHDRDSYDWKKDLDGVKITVYSAEDLHAPLEGSPVPPQAFPVLLMDADANTQPRQSTAPDDIF